MSTRTAVIEALGLIEGAHPGRLPHDHQRTIATWEMYLGEMSDSAIVEAAKDLCSADREHPPNVGQVRHRAAQLTLGQLAPPSPFEAWERVQKRVRGEEIDFTEDEKRALDIIGGIRTAQTSTNIATDRAHFFQAYKAFTDRRIAETRAHKTTRALAASNAPKSPALPAAPDGRLTTPEHRASDPEIVSRLLDGLKGYRYEHPREEEY